VQQSESGAIFHYFFILILERFTLSSYNLILLALSVNTLNYSIKLSLHPPAAATAFRILLNICYDLILLAFSVDILNHSIKFKKFIKFFAYQKDNSSYHSSSAYRYVKKKGKIFLSSARGGLYNPPGPGEKVFI
jgi:uncharacterized membrane protein